MLKLDKEKLVGLKTFDDHLQERYGGENSPERKEFEAKAWYYAELLKDQRKRQNVTQKVLATFLRIADALGLRFFLVLGQMKYNRS